MADDAAVEALARMLEQAWEAWEKAERSTRGRLNQWQARAALAHLAQRGELPYARRETDSTNELSPVWSEVPQGFCTKCGYMRPAHEAEAEVARLRAEIERKRRLRVQVSEDSQMHCARMVAAEKRNAALVGALTEARLLLYHFAHVSFRHVDRCSCGLCTDANAWLPTADALLAAEPGAPGAQP